MLGTRITVLKRKIAKDGEVERYTLPFEAQGVCQVKELHYQEFSSRAPTQSIIFMALALMTLAEGEGFSWTFRLRTSRRMLKRSSMLSFPTGKATYGSRCVECKISELLTRRVACRLMFLVHVTLYTVPRRVIRERLTVDKWSYPLLLLCLEIEHKRQSVRGCSPPSSTPHRLAGDPILAYGQPRQYNGEDKTDED